MTKSKILSATVIVSIGAILLLWAPSTAYAGVDNMPAIVLKEGEEVCFFFIDEPLGTEQKADKLTLVANKNKIVLTCHAFGVPNTTGSAIKLEYACGASSDYGIAIGLCKVVVSYDEATDTGNATMRFRGTYV